MIRFLVTGQQLNIVTPIVVADTHNYQTAEAVFRGSAWEPCSKWAHFIKDGEHYTLPFHNDAISAQQGLNLTAGTWQVYLHGSYYDAQTDTVSVRITSSTALLKVEAAELTEPFPPVTPSLSEVLAAEVENALAVAQGVRQDAAAGMFDGATYTPSVSAEGVLSFTNDKGRPDPAPVNVRGPAGKDGRDFTLLGYYDSLSQLRAAVPEPAVGSAYGVGTEPPYTVYIFDGVSLDWVDNGTIQGAKGDPGAAATVSVGTVSTLPYGENAAVTNSGTESAAVLNFAIPQGKTPVKGTDYWTEADKQSIGASITPQMIGAVPEPESKNSGDVLKWSGSAWIAGDANENGVQSVDGKTGAVKTRLIFQNQSIAASAFTLQANPTYPDFPYIGSKALSGVTADMIPQIFFAGADAVGGNFAPVAESYSGGVYLYARKAPTGNTGIPVILMTV